MPAPTHRRAIARIILAFILLAMIAATTTRASSPPLPIITFISPVSALRGGAITLTVNGAGFLFGANASIVQWNGTALATTFISNDQLTAEVPSALMAGQGTAWLTVANPACSGACTRTSNVIYFPVGTPVATLEFGSSLAATLASPPNEMAAGDFNSDGKLDLAVSNSTGNTVSIFLGNGDATFQPPTSFPTTVNPWGIAVGDLNGDGIPDLVVGSNSAAGMTIAIGNGSGGFTATPLPGALCPMNPALADVNQDGKLDIVVGSQCSNGILVYLGNGDGTFQPPIGVNGSSRVNTLVLADFDGDGNLDIAAADANLGTTDIYLGAGDGTFSLAAQCPATTSATSINAADFDGDGKLDLVVAGGGSTGMVILRGNGDGTFQAAGSIASPAALLSLAAVGDLNADGNLDIVGINTSGVLQAWLGNGDGTFQSATQTLSTGNNGAGILLGNFVNGGELNVAAGFGAGVNLDLPTLSISPASFNFGTVNLNSAAQQTFTLTNHSPNPVNFTSASFVGSDLQDFTQTNTCSAPIAAAATCSVTVTFSPPVAGARLADLMITDSAPGSPQFAVLTGTGVSAPLASISTSSLSFGSLNLGVTSPAQIVAVTNTGTAPLTGLSGNLVGTNAADFFQTNNCPDPLPIFSPCNFSVTFTPSDLGPRSAVLQISDNAPDNPQMVSLSGIGILSASQLVFTTPPPSAISAGTSIGTIGVAVETSRSTIVASSNAAIQVNIAGPDSFSSTQTRAAVSGVAAFNFSNTLLNVAGTYTITATSENLSPAAATTTVAPLNQARMIVSGFPTPAFPALPYAFTVSAADVFGNPIPDYAGTVTLSSTDASAILLPPSYTFVAADMGIHTFNGTLFTLGTQSISATDQTLSGSEAGIQVVAPTQFVVNTLTDDSGTSSCQGSDTCSLRSAIDQSNLQRAGDITFDTSLFTGSAPFSLTLASGPLELSAEINIAGPAATQLSISANGGFSVFEVGAGALVTISGLTATAGSTAGNGGVIRSAGTLTLSSVSLTNSFAAGNGGGIYNSGVLTLNSSEISGTSAAGNGGAVDNSGVLTVLQSTISGDAAADGAGIENESSGVLTLMQSTISANVATGVSGGTVSNQNQAQGSVTILESIVAGNTAPGGDCLNCGAQAEFNLFEVPAASLQLGSLAANGGTTRTMIPLPGSMAIGAGSVELVENSGMSPSLANDQRGAGFPRVVNGGVDLGAVQSNSGPAVSMALLGAGSARAGESFSITLNAFAAGGNPAATFADTVHFTSTDAQATLPPDYAFMPADLGSHVFSVTLKTSGSQTITATDAQNVAVTAMRSLTISHAAASAIVAAAGSGQTAGVNTVYAASLKAKVTDAYGNGVPAVRITFAAPASGASGTFSGGASSANVSADSSGIATAPAFTADSTIGGFTVTAMAQNLGAAQFSLTNVNAASQDFSIAANPPALTIVQGQSGSTVLTFTPVGSFAGTATLSCSGLPAQSNCVFVPPQAVMTGNNAAVSVTLTLNTAGANGQLSYLTPRALPGPAHSGTVESFSATLIAFLAAAIFVCSNARWKNHRRPRRATLHLDPSRFALLLAMLAGTGLISCGVASPSSTPQTSATTPGTYAVNIVATSSSGTQTASITINVVKQ